MNNIKTVILSVFFLIIVFVFAYEPEMNADDYNTILNVLDELDGGLAYAYSICKNIRTGEINFNDIDDAVEFINIFEEMIDDVLSTHAVFRVPEINRVVKELKTQRKAININNIYDRLRSGKDNPKIFDIINLVVEKEIQ